MRLLYSVHHVNIGKRTWLDMVRREGIEHVLRQTNFVSAKSSLRTAWAVVLVALPLSLAGCDHGDPTREPEGPTKSEWVRALYAYKDRQLDMSIDEAIDSYDDLGDAMCKGMKSEGVSKFLGDPRASGRGNAFSDYGTRFRCRELREQYIKSGGFVLDVDELNARDT